MMSTQLPEIEARREQGLTHESTDEAVRQIQAPMPLYGLGVGTAADLSHEVSASMFSCLDIIRHPLTDG
jgi:uncharacterized protein YoaH (UPF0181 family)